MIKGNAIVGQSGGPTSVINSSLAGVMSAAKKYETIEKLYGMHFGIEGFMKEDLWDLSAQSDSVIDGLRQTPSSALGSSRHKVQESDFPKILDVFKKFNIRYFFLIGGNDTMDTIHRVEEYCKKEGYEFYGVGVPKTVDNDLYGTDHTPGFASAARYNALSVQQAGALARDMKKVDQFVVYQTIGRDAGWLAAATVMAKQHDDDGPHLIYCPERVFDADKFLEDAKKCIEKYGWVSVVVSEGLKYADGTPVSAAQDSDKFGNTEFGAMGGASVGLSIHKILSKKLGLRGEFQITESLIMSAIDRAIPEDLQKAFDCGERAVELAVQGTSAVMVTIERVVKNGKVTFEYGTAPLSSVAVRAKAMPDDFINEEGNYVTEKFLDYIQPLIPELPRFTRLEDKFA
jgi:ATP-dependent phosphofructokinase / diphosphate-dependent phosphofructokinase